MVISTNQKSSTIWFIVLAFLILVANFLLMKSPLFHPITIDLAFVTILDLTFCLPILFYFLVVRKRHSPIYIIPVILLGFWISYLLVPNQFFAHVKPFMYLLYAAEGLFIAGEIYLIYLAIRKLPKLLKRVKYYHEKYPQFIIAFRKAIKEIAGASKVGEIWITDLSVFYYAIFSWKTKGREGEGYYSYHKETGYLAMVIMLAHALTIEMIGVHFLIAQKSHLAAWIITSFDLYALLFLVADYRAAKLSPITIQDKHLTIQIGLRRSIEVPLHLVKQVQQTTTSKDKRKKETNSFFATLPELIEEVEPKYEVLLSAPIKAHYMYGIKKEINKIYISVDEHQSFYQTLLKEVEINKQHSQ